MSEAALYSIDNGIATITLNRPETLNAFNRDIFACLRSGLDEAEADPGIIAVVITGAGRAFSSGQDLLGDLASDADGNPDLGLALEENYNPLARRLIAFPKITVAALNGLAVGAAANLALACDIIVAAQSAYLQLAFARIGLIPDAGGTWLLPRIAGSKRALALALTGDRVTAEDAKSLGIVYRVFPDAEFAAELQMFTAKFVNGPATAYRLIKEAFRQSPDNDFETQLALESQLQQEAGRTSDFREALRGFAEKRPPAFSGR